MRAVGCPGLSRSASLRIVVDLHLVRLLAELAPARQEPVISSLRRTVTGTGWRSSRTAFFCRLSGIPPNRATSGFLPSPRSTLAWKHVRGPCGVSIFGLVLARHLRHRRAVLAGQGLEHRGLHDPVQPVRVGRRRRRAGSTGRCPGTRPRRWLTMVWSSSFISSGRRAGLPRCMYGAHLALITVRGHAQPDRRR